MYPKISQEICQKRQKRSGQMLSEIIRIVFIMQLSKNQTREEEIPTPIPRSARLATSRFPRCGLASAGKTGKRWA